MHFEDQIALFWIRAKICRYFVIFILMEKVIKKYFMEKVFYGKILKWINFYGKSFLRKAQHGDAAPKIACPDIPITCFSAGPPGVLPASPDGVL